ncbi:hypothetical protein K9N68_32350 [Kovacikia minuta CCNUW1]|uniref:hypothetical protein n=1 Tax=Kovacikia minuta TaxID=2931930 RepID=UPI001CC92547|nr:hypothetical protein [Kovacikia minuta]UBF26162.1 hypothetical protein K9N68_32350 [Kovacikia minuta CCNUW1]
MLSYSKVDARGNVLELRQRGHDVVFVTHQVYQSKLAALNFEFHPMRPDFTAMNDPQEMARMMDLKTGQEYMVRQRATPSLREMYTDLLNVTKGADFIFSGEGVIAMSLVAEKLEMRWACSISPNGKPKHSTFYIAPLQLPLD